MKQLVIALLLVGCTASSEPQERTFCIAREIGDANAPIALRIEGRVVGSTEVILTVHATNLDICAVAISARSATGDQSGVIVELDSNGAIAGGGPRDLLHVAIDPDSDAAIDVTVQDATGKWAGARWTP